MGLSFLSNLTQALLWGLETMEPCEADISPSWLRPGPSSACSAPYTPPFKVPYRLGVGAQPAL